MRVEGPAVPGADEDFAFAAVVGFMAGGARVRYAAEPAGRQGGALVGTAVVQGINASGAVHDDQALAAHFERVGPAGGEIGGFAYIVFLSLHVESPLSMARTRSLRGGIMPKSNRAVKWFAPAGASRLRPAFRWTTP